ncbi:MAG: alkyl/aryl-sulfatase [Qingshengfaniella sp.]
MRTLAAHGLCLALGLLSGPTPGIAQSATAPAPATETTTAANAALYEQLDFNDRSDFDDALRGRIAEIPHDTLTAPSGRAIWSPGDFDFIGQDGEAPASVNPSLWRQAQLNGITGLFEVTEGIYQIRGADLANISIIEGETGLIVIDALMSAETSRAAMDLYFAHRPHKPIRAFIYSHNHVDHFGGARGILNADFTDETTQILAPEGFMETLVGENIIAGPAMNRRIQYQFGTGLDTGDRARVDGGLGQTISVGTVTVVPPTLEIGPDNLNQTIDGVDFEFMITSGAEAPAELVFYLPQHKALNTTDTVTPLLHNLYAIRGAAVRSGADWSRYIFRIMQRFPEAEIIFGQHHWPKWGTERVQGFLTAQRDLYKHIHDQSLRMINKGFTAQEIADAITLPDALSDSWWIRGYYGTVEHNAKAQYQLYMGWYDGNPASLNPLPPQEAAMHYVDYMGGVAAVIDRARQDFEAGNYRWVAEILRHVVFADPANTEARALQAAAFEQLGYQAESAIWRNAYLQGAHELRNGVNAQGAQIVSPDLISAMTPDMYFDFLGVNLDPEKAAGHTISAVWTFEDLDQSYFVTVENATLSAIAGDFPAEPDVTVTLDKTLLDQIVGRATTFDEAITAGDITVTGDGAALSAFFTFFDRGVPNFNMIEP